MKEVLQSFARIRNELAEIGPTTKLARNVFRFFFVSNLVASSSKKTLDHTQVKAVLNVREKQAPSTVGVFPAHTDIADIQQLEIVVDQIPGKRLYPPDKGFNGSCSEKRRGDNKSAIWASVQDSAPNLATIFRLSLSFQREIFSSSASEGCRTKGTTAVASATSILSSSASEGCGTAATAATSSSASEGC